MLRNRLFVSALFVAAGSLAVAAVVPARSAQAPVAPTEFHKQLLSSVGNWEGTLTMFMPGMPAEPTPAKEKVEAIGGFWTQSHFECSFMGMPYHGTGFNGYDPAKKKHLGTWIDNMGPALAVMEGEMDANKKLVMRYEAPDQMTGAMTAHRIETVFGDNHYTSTFFQGAGEGNKTMVIDMKRAAGRPVEAGAGNK